ncbi:hypothetical protein KSI47_24345, partial [Salmonella enterica subsp. enterica serovar Indiana]|nr:hypothetical protein [Salmonella enterica subsp. enterica serovar Indiana]
MDHHKDTLIYSDLVKTNILGVKRVLDGDLIFGEIRLTGLLFNLKTYKNEKKTNLDVFIHSFETGKPTPPSAKKFLLTAKDA